MNNELEKRKVKAFEKIANELERLNNNFEKTIDRDGVINIGRRY